MVDDLPHAVQQASYVDSAETSGDAPIASPSDENYWSTVKASAVASMEAVEARSANVPVVFEEITKSSWSQLAFHFAFLFGIAAACGYMHWLKFAPIRRGLPFRDQPISVLARIGTYSGTIALALISSIAVWI